MNFKNLEVPAMQGPKMMPSRRRHNSTHPLGFQTFNFLHVLKKNNEFNNSKGTEVPAMRGAEMMPSRRRQKSTHPSGFQHFNFLHDFLKNQWISKIWRYRPCGMPKWCPPGGGKNRHIDQDFRISTFCMFWTKINEFHKSEGTGHAGTRNDAVLEAAEIDTSSRIFVFFLCIFSAQVPSLTSSLRPLPDHTSLAQRIVRG